MSTPLPWTTAWVTGASSGIGREIAIRLARGGLVARLGNQESFRFQADAQSCSYGWLVVDNQYVNRRLRSARHGL